MPPPVLRTLGRVDYLPTLDGDARLHRGARGRHAPTRSGCANTRRSTPRAWPGKAEHVLDAHGIPVVQTNRGGQVTYHGPGQVVAYPLIDLQRLGIYVKEYVYRIEHSVIKTLESFGVTGHRVPGAPGIYVRLADPFGHAPLDDRTLRSVRRPAAPIRLPTFAAWARSPRWASRSAATAPTTAWR